MLRLCRCAVTARGASLRSPGKHLPEKYTRGLLSTLKQSTDARDARLGPETYPRKPIRPPPPPSIPKSWIQKRWEAHHGPPPHESDFIAYNKYYRARNKKVRSYRNRALVALLALGATGYSIDILRNHGGKIPDAHVNSVLHYIPTRMLSATWGKVHRIDLPESWREPFYTAWSEVFGGNLDEIGADRLSDYPNLNAFFVRTLKPGARPCAPDTLLSSPSDGTVVHCGPITDRKLVEQVKGVTYGLDYLLEGKAEAHIPDLDDTTDLHHIVIYLGPGDYHRFHSPTTWRVRSRAHMSGELLPVNLPVVKYVPRLFTLNERVALQGTWRHGFFSFIAVGAYNVGDIRLIFDPDLDTNHWRDPTPTANAYEIGRVRRRSFKDADITLYQNNEVGRFELGSTLILVFRAPKDFVFTVSGGDAVKVGQEIGRLANDK